MTGILGARVLVVEDETVLRVDLEDMLSDFGCSIVGGAGRIDSAMELAGAVTCDVAILETVHNRNRRSIVAFTWQSGSCRLAGRLLLRSGSPRLRVRLLYPVIHGESP